MKKVYDASDAEKVKESEQKDRGSYYTAKDDLKKLLVEKWGRRIVWRILDRAGVYQSSFTGNAATTAHREGQRNLGLWFLKEIEEVDIDSYLLSIKENRTEI
jgi:hypothetical protein